MIRDEKDLPTQQHEPKTNPWVPRSHEDCGRSRSYKTQTHKRTKASECANPSKTVSGLKSTGSRSDFPKSARLLARKDFLAIQNEGNRCHSRHFVVITSRSGNVRPRLGITASRKFGNAIARNKIKRRLREIFRLQQEKLETGYDILIIPKFKARHLSFAQTQNELERVLPFAKPTK